MAQDHRRLHLKDADAAVGVIVHVRAADPDRMQLHPHIPRPQHLFDREIAQRQAMLLLQNQRFHALAP